MHHDELSPTKISKFVINTLDKSLTNLSTLKVFNHKVQNQEVENKSLSRPYTVTFLLKIIYPLDLDWETHRFLSYVPHRGNSIF